MLNGPIILLVSPNPADGILPKELARDLIYKISLFLFFCYGSKGVESPDRHVSELLLLMNDLGNYEKIFLFIFIFPFFSSKMKFIFAITGIFDGISGRIQLRITA